ncbi:uncharacterized protein LOC117588950 [Drosophila guanche]|uniref:Uncharacterized protein n=1 Tax=Drosophila guanche TaxID=7266 RepID=A0A3B0KT38_DROGU|nr:uncharacterized protein LOC117588950 [Drosophila guanche]SPP87058.1 Hypothetical predicted protein [Drosophila guanche]
MENMTEGRVASRSCGMLPSALLTLRMLGQMEEKEQQDAEELYENCTSCWRDQFKNPNMANFAIGMEFMKQSQRTPLSSGPSFSLYSDNGNSSIETPRLFQSHLSDPPAISDVEPHSAFITGKSWSRRCRI